MKDATYIGIDGGITGAMAAHHPDGTWQLRPVTVIDAGKDPLLDVWANFQFIREVSERAGGLENIVVVFEHAKKNPIFGAKGNFANGRHTEFWRVLLTFARIPFACVDPNTWQSHVFRGLAGTDTKTKARLYVEQRYPAAPLDQFKKRSDLEGVRDAMCIAAWARASLP
jgi:hypothetical protein